MDQAIKVGLQSVIFLLNVMKIPSARDSLMDFIRCGRLSTEVWIKASSSPYIEETNSNTFRSTSRIFTQSHQMPSSKCPKGSFILFHTNSLVHIICRARAFLPHVLESFTLKIHRESSLLLKLRNKRLIPWKTSNGFGFHA